MPAWLLVGPLVSFHLVRDRSTATSLRRLATERSALRRVQGVTFVRVLGTGRGADTGPSVDPRRTAVLLVWTGAEAYGRFVDHHGDAASWRGAAESWHCLMRPLRHRGSWGGVDPLAAAADGDVDVDGPVVVLTRASIRTSAVPAFVRTGRRHRHTAAAAPGCLAVAGIGDVPFLRLGTCSVWSTTEAACAYAADAAAHGDAAAAARRAGWFTEELFAWFAPVASAGTWDGADPLAPTERVPSRPENISG